MADKKWYRCELLDRETEELLGYFTCLAEKPEGEGGSAAEAYYSIFETDDCDACDSGDEFPILEDVVACDDPTIPNDYDRTGLLRSELEKAVNDKLQLTGERDKARAELAGAQLVIETLRRELRELGRGLVTAAHVALSVGRE